MDRLSLPLLVFVVITLSVRECQSRHTTASTCDGQIHISGTGASSASGQMDILGNGYARWRSSHGRTVTFGYISTSSKSATDLQRQNVTGKQAVFAVSSITAGPHQDRKEITEIPLVAWPLLIIFNIPNVRHLQITVEILSEIYLGEILFWDDQRIRDINPSVLLPHQHISPVASAEDSGNTKIATAAFSSVNPLWREKYGTFSDPAFSNSACCESNAWPNRTVKYYGKQSVGVVAIVASIPYTIGYAAAGLADYLDVAVADLLNAEGIKVQPSVEAVLATLGESKDSTLRTPLGNAYPLVGINYVSFNTATAPGITCCQMQELSGLVDWMLKYYGELFKNEGVVAVGNKASRRASRQVLQHMRCEGMNVYDMYKESMKKKSFMSNMQLGAIVAAVTTMIGLSAILGYAVINARFNREKKLNWLIFSGYIHKGGGGFGSSSTSGSVSMRSLAGVRAEYDKSPCMLCQITAPSPTSWSRGTQRHFSKLMRTIKHDNILEVLGATCIDGNTTIVTEYPSKGTLRQALRRLRFSLDDDVKMVLSMNFFQGLSHLHSKHIVHGLLNCYTCYIDASWTLKIGQWVDLAVCRRENPYALFDLYSGDFGTMTEEEIVRLFYLDPRALKGTFDEAGDIFSAGILMFEIFTFSKETNFNTEEMKALLTKKMSKGTSQLPQVTVSYPQSVEFLIRMCLGQPQTRPTISVMYSEVSKLRRTKRGIVDILTETMEIYSAGLEDTVNKRTADLTAKSTALEGMTRKMEDLINEVLPPTVAKKLLAGEPVEPQSFESATIYFADIVGFTKISCSSTPTEVMTLLNDLWSLFDSILIKYDVYKVDTIGDAYMVCSGLPEENGLDHVREICRMALDVSLACYSFRFRHRPTEKLKIRVGIHTGPVTTGIVGSKMPQYCVFGDTVNIASQLEQNSQAMKINISETTRNIAVLNFNEFIISYHTKLELAKDKHLSCFWLEGLKPINNKAQLAP